MQPDPVPTPDHFRGMWFRTYLLTLIGWLKRNRVVISPGSGLLAVATPDGMALKSDMSGGLQWGTLPAGGIAAGGTGTVTLTRSGATIDLPNLWSTAAPSLRKCIVGYVDDELAIIVWDC